MTARVVLACLCVVVLGCGCGRIGFESHDASDELLLVRCLDDNFDDGDSTGWTTILPAWAIEPAAGVDGTPAWGGRGGGYVAVTHPGLHGVRALRLSVDYRLDSAAAGDFIVRFGLAGKFGDQDPHYSVNIYVENSDTFPDAIGFGPPETIFTVGPSITQVSRWHRLEIELLPSAAITVQLDGAPHLASGPDTTLDGPVDLVFRIFANGAIDNVVADCAR